jgi:AraC-like DNA-binding protein
MRPLDRPTWLGRLGDGTLAIAFLTAGHSQFSADWGHRNRTLPGAHLLYGVTGGTLRVRAGGLDRAVHAGEMVWISAGVRHDLLPERPGGRIAAFHARLSCLDGQQRPWRLADDCLIAASAGGAEDAVAAVFAEQRRSRPWLEHRLAARWVLLFAAVFAASGRSSQALSADQEAAVRRCVDAAPPAHRLQPADLARAAQLAPRYFARRFSATFAQTPRSWLVAERMRLAASWLLERESAIGVIAEELGYDDLFLFSRQFLQVAGVSPSRYRRAHGR